MTVKHRTSVQRVSAALSFIMMMVLAGCPTETDPESGGDPDLTGTITVQKGGAAVTTAITGDPLTAVYSGGTETVTYQWNKDSDAISGATNATYTPAEAGSYTVTVSATGYKSKSSAAVKVSGATLSTLSGTITIQKGGAAVTTAITGDPLTAVYSGGTETVTYQWNKDSDAISGATNATYTPAEAGSYTVTVSATGYKSKSSAAVTVTVQPTVPLADLQSYIYNLQQTPPQTPTRSNLRLPISGQTASWAILIRRYRASTSS